MAGDALALEYSRPVLARTGPYWPVLARAGPRRQVPASAGQCRPVLWNRLLADRSVFLAWVDAGIYRAGPLG